MFFVLPLVVQSWWDGDLAGAGIKSAKMTYTIDTNKKSLAVSDALAKGFEQKKNEELPDRFDFAGDVSIVATKFWPEKKDDKRPTKKYSRVTVEVKGGKGQVLAENAPEGCQFSPSPNG